MHVKVVTKSITFLLNKYIKVVVLCLKKKYLSTTLNMLFLPTLTVNVEFTAILRVLGNDKNAKQGLEGQMGCCLGY